jgi:hypothetical protein
MLYVFKLWFLPNLGLSKSPQGAMLMKTSNLKKSTTLVFADFFSKTYKLWFLQTFSQKPTNSGFCRLFLKKSNLDKNVLAS